MVVFLVNHSWDGLPENQRDRECRAAGEAVAEKPHKKKQLNENNAVDADAALTYVHDSLAAEIRSSPEHEGEMLQRVFRKTLYYLSGRDCVNTHLFNNSASAKSGCD